MFSNGMFYCRFLAISFWVTGFAFHCCRFEYFLDFFLIFNFSKMLLLVRQLALSLSCDNYLVPFHLWRQETVHKRKKVKDCLIIFLSLFTSLKTHGNSKNGWSFSWNKWNLFIYSALPKCEGLLVLNLYLKLKSKLVLFEIYQI